MIFPLDSAKLSQISFWGRSSIPVGTTGTSLVRVPDCCAPENEVNRGRSGCCPGQRPGSSPGRLMYWVYILESQATGQYYIGYTADLDDRIRRHNQGLTQTTRRRRGPWVLVYQEVFSIKTEAIKRERQIKKWKDRDKIERLINS